MNLLGDLTHALGQALAGDTGDGLFGSGVDLRQHQLVHHIEDLAELAEMGLGAAEAVRLEGHHQTAIGEDLPGRGQRGRDLGRMMTVVIDDGHAIAFALEFKATSHAPEGGQTFHAALEGDVGSRGGADGGQSIEDIVAAGMG